jgi:hypothetical protein
MTPKRDIVWLIADLECRTALTGFLDRETFHLSLGCGEFLWDANQDVLRDEKGKDCGVWKNAHVLLRGKRTTYHHAIVLVDNAFGGSPGPQRVEADILGNLQTVGWPRSDVEVIVLDPELEIWIWQRNPNVEQAFDYTGPPSLWNLLAERAVSPEHRLVNADPDRGLLPAWPLEAAKPGDPKAVVEAVRDLCNSDPPSAIFNAITARVSVKGVDPAFLKLRGTLRKWFPAKGAGA